MQKTHYQVSKSTHSKQIVLMAENIRTPENLGMLLRLADAFGIEKVYFLGEFTVPLSTKAKRASRNTVNTVTHEIVTHDYEGVLNSFKEEGYEICSLEITETSRALVEAKPQGNKVVLIVGAERTGISERLLKRSDVHLHIPLYGDNSSLNVVHATAIALHEIVRQTPDRF